MTKAHEFRWVRKKLALSQIEFGQIMAVSARTVLAWEKGHSLPSAYHMAVMTRIDALASSADDAGAIVRRFHQDRRRNDTPAATVFSFLSWLFSADRSSVTDL